MRGFWFTMEAVVAGVIMLSFLGFVATASFSAPADLSPSAYTALDNLNRQRLLKGYAEAGNATALSDSVDIPYNHSVEICTLAGCSGTKLTARNVWVGSYITPGSGSYTPAEVRLYVYG